MSAAAVLRRAFRAAMLNRRHLIRTLTAIAEQEQNGRRRKGETTPWIGLLSLLIC